MLDPSHTESAYQRTRRNFWPFVTGHWVGWLVLVGLAICGAAAGSYLSWHDSRGGTSAVTLLTGAGAVVAGLILVFLGLWFAGPILQRNEARAALAVGLETTPTVTFKAEGIHELKVEVTKPGQSLSNAAIVLTVPGSFDSLHRIGGPERHWSERLPDGRLVWDEKNLEVVGGGVYRTTWSFRTLVPPGDHELSLVLSDDALPTAVQVEEVLSAPATAEWAAYERQQLQGRRNHLAGMRKRLAVEEAFLSRVLESGQVTPASGDEMRLHQGGGVPKLKAGHFGGALLDARSLAGVNEGLRRGSEAFERYRQSLNRAANAQQRAFQQARMEARKTGGQPPEAPQGLTAVPAVVDDNLREAVSAVQAAIALIDAALRDQT